MASTDCIVVNGNLEEIDPSLTWVISLQGVTLTQAGVAIPAIEGTWAAVTNIYITGFQFQYTNSNQAGGTSSDFAKSTDLMWSGTNGVLAGVTYSARYRAVGVSGAYGPWSNWISLTIPGAFVSSNTAPNGTPAFGVDASGTTYLQNLVIEGSLVLEGTVDTTQLAGGAATAFGYQTTTLNSPQALPVLASSSAPPSPPSSGGGGGGGGNRKGVQP